MKKILALLLVASKLATAQEIEKPFIKEHEEHKHKIDFTNVSVFQAIRDYSTIYNFSVITSIQTILFLFIQEYHLATV